jgi:hypothetical protein
MILFKDVVSILTLPELAPVAHRSLRLQLVHGRRIGAFLLTVLCTIRYADCDHADVVVQVFAFAPG